MSSTDVSPSIHYWTLSTISTYMHDKKAKTDHTILYILVMTHVRLECTLEPLWYSEGVLESRRA